MRNKIISISRKAVITAVFIGFWGTGGLKGEYEKMNDIIKLPEPVIKGEISLEQAIYTRHSVRSYSNKPLTLEDVSQLLWAAGGERVDAVTSASRTYPSAGACYPLEFYLVVGKVEGIEPGLYYYQADRHALKSMIKGELRNTLTHEGYSQSVIKNAPATVVVTAIYPKTTKKYGKRGEKYVSMDSGYSGENIYLMAAARGLGTVAVGAFNEMGIKRVLRLHDNEVPVCLYPVGYPR
ncbi:SagB/ThcOx family dehydrogenase [Elusimicrobiota bacterium]